MAPNRTAVLIHGFHVDSRLGMAAWHDLVLGHLDDGRLDGRATYGVQLAFNLVADLVVFSTGASERDGLKEAEYTYRAVQRQIEKLSECLGVTADDLFEWLAPRVELDTVSQNTSEELNRNLRLCAERECWRVYLVTNRFHAPRALANANDARDRLGLGGKMRIFASAPDDGTPAPVIFEPATRPDRPSHDWHGTLPGIFSIPADHQAEALWEIRQVINKYRRS